METRSWHLRKLDIFSGLSEEELNQLEGMATTASFSKGQYLYSPGEAAESVFILEQGRIKLTLVSEQGREFTISFLGPGEFFGELALMEEGRRSSAAMALEETLVSIIGRSDLERFLTERPSLLYKLARFIGKRRQQIETRLADLAFRKVPARMARVLVHLADEYGESGPEGLKLRLKLVHQEIANLIGSSREMATITLNKMQRAKLLRYDKRHIIILDRAGLERMT